MGVMGVTLSEMNEWSFRVILHTISAAQLNRVTAVFAVIGRKTSTLWIMVLLCSAAVWYDLCFKTNFKLKNYHYSHLF